MNQFQDAKQKARLKNRQAFCFLAKVGFLVDSLKKGFL